MNLVALVACKIWISETTNPEKLYGPENILLCIFKNSTVVYMRGWSSYQQSVALASILIYISETTASEKFCLMIVGQSVALVTCQIRISRTTNPENLYTKNILLHTFKNAFIIRAKARSSSDVSDQQFGCLGYAWNFNCWYNIPWEISFYICSKMLSSFEQRLEA